MITPNIPSPTAIAASAGCARSTVCSVLSAPTTSSATTAVARIPLASPDPWVPVAVAPAIEMCGSEPVLCSAKPWECSAAANSP